MAIPARATLTISAEAANSRTVAVQLQNGSGVDLVNRGVVEMYLSSDSAGDTPIASTASDSVITSGTDGAVVSASAATGVNATMFVSEVDGDIDVVITNATDQAKTVYLNVIMPNGKIVTSSAIAFVDDTP